MSHAIVYDMYVIIASLILALGAFLTYKQIKEIVKLVFFPKFQVPKSLSK